jgi:hypothetical protein
MRNPPPRGPQGMSEAEKPKRSWFSPGNQPKEALRKF